MVQNRDSSYTLCKGFIKELFNKYNNIEQVNFEILDILDKSIKTNININGKVKTFNIILDRKKKEVAIKSLDNLKKPNKKNNENNENSESLKSLNNENKRNAIIIVSDDENKENKYIDNNNVISNNFDIEIENTNNIKINMDDTHKKEDVKKIIDGTNILNNENKNLKENINEKCINNDNNGTEYEESEPENECDYEDPHFLKYPDEFRCYNCYETNIEKSKLFNYAQEMIYKCNDLEEDNEKLKKDNVDKDKIINVYKNENRELKNIISKEEDKYMNFINDLNDNFMDLFLNAHKSFDCIKDILLKLEKTNPKKVHEVLNKNIKIYKEDIQKIADEANKIRKKHIEISNNNFGDKIKIVD